MGGFGLLGVAGVALLALAAVGAGYGGFATILLVRFVRRAPSAPARWPRVSVLRPMHGAEPEIDLNLESLAELAYAGELQIVLGAAEPADPALAAARAFAARRPDMDIRIVQDPTLYGSNRKISNLINMRRVADGEVIVISDSDVRLAPGDLDAIVASLETPGAGLAHCLYRGRPTDAGWSAFAALDVNARFASSVVVGEAAGAHPCLGPTMALRADVLERLGGFERLKDLLADDFELGRLVRSLGLGLVCPPIVIDHVFPERSLGDVARHELRWARTIRLVQPAGYAGSAIMHVTPLALVGAALTGCAAASTLVALLLVATRWIEAAIQVRLLKADGRLLWSLPARDLVAALVFLGAWLGRRVDWRGRSFAVAAGGEMSAS